MARVEQELAIAANAFVESLAAFRENRSKNNCSQAADAVRNGTP
jgi:hypothetical protein